MGNITSSSSLFKTCLISSSLANNKKKVVEILESIDGKVMTTFTSPITVKDAIARLSSSGADSEIIGLSKEPDSDSLRPDYELKIGMVYYATVPRVNRVKVVITKQQLRELLEQQISLEEVLLLGLENNKKNIKSLLSVGDHLFSNRRSRLESIPEEIE